MAQQSNGRLRRYIGLVLTLTVVVAGCSSTPFNAAPPTIEAARPALSPAVSTAPAGEVTELRARPTAALFDGRTGYLAAFIPGPEPRLSLFGGRGNKTVALPGPATSMTGNGDGVVYLASRGGYFSVELAAGTTARVDVPGEAETDFTALARRADGRFVLGSADGTAFTLTADGRVAERAKIFAHVDAIVTVGDDAVVLDRGQTSVTALDGRGKAQQALRAGEGATTMTSDAAGRVLVADTRGGQLLVFGVDPLIERQAYPVPGAPYGLAGSAKLAWISQTASNVVVGYDLATGIPVEKVRYPTVQQPDSLAYDEASNTLYVVSGSGAGVQVIRNAAGTG